jgi:DNA-directed RNA polymerase subunit RPC12/RpoP
VTIWIECQYCGHRKTIKEPSLDVHDDTLERTIVDLDLYKQAPCPHCGKKSWRVLESNEK